MNSKDGGPLTFEEVTKLTIEQIAHITIAVPRVLKGDGCDYTYFQSVCSCGWHGTYRVSKLTAQMDTCPNR